MFDVSRAFCNRESAIPSSGHHMYTDTSVITTACPRSQESLTKSACWSGHSPMFCGPPLPVPADTSCCIAHQSIAVFVLFQLLVACECTKAPVPNTGAPVGWRMSD